MKCDDFWNLFQPLQEVYLSDVGMFDGIVDVFEIHLFQCKYLTLFTEHFIYLDTEK